MRIRALVSASALALGLCVPIAAAPVAGAQSEVPGIGDLTDGGRLGGGSTQFELPGGLALGSLGGPELESVDEVDPERYSGKWYQIAAIPQPFSLQCTSDTTAEYAVLDAERISVRNSCRSAISADSVIEGEAKVVDADTGASLRVSFDGVPFQNPDGPPNYRVTYLADDYSLAIVGDPTRSSGFVLSRTPGVSAETWRLVRSTVEDRGWWSCAFVTEPSVGGRTDATPLCLL